MEFFILQTFVILTLTYFLGAVIGCVLRARSLRKAALLNGKAQDKGYAYAGGYVEPVEPDLQPRAHTFQAGEGGNEKRDQDMEMLAGAVAASAGVGGLAAFANSTHIKSTQDELLAPEEKSVENISAEPEDISVTETTTPSQIYNVENAEQEVVEQAPVPEKQDVQEAVESGESEPCFAVEEVEQSGSHQSIDETYLEEQDENTAPQVVEVEALTAHEEVTHEEAAYEEQETHHGHDAQDEAVSEIELQKTDMQSEVEDSVPSVAGLSLEEVADHDLQQNNAEETQTDHPSEIPEHVQPEVIMSSQPQDSIDHEFETLSELSEEKEHSFAEVTAEATGEPQIDFTSHVVNVMDQTGDTNTDSTNIDSTDADSTDIASTDTGSLNHDVDNHDIETVQPTDDVSEAFQEDVHDVHHEENQERSVEQVAGSETGGKSTEIASDIDPVAEENEPEAPVEQQESGLNNVSLHSVESEEHEISVADDVRQSEALLPEPSQDQTSQPEPSQEEISETGSVEVDQPEREHEDSVQQQYESVFQSEAQTFTPVSTLAEEVVDVLEETPSQMSESVSDENVQPDEPVGIVLEAVKPEEDAESAKDGQHYIEAEDISYEEISSDPSQEEHTPDVSAAQMAAAAFASPLDEGVIEKIATGPGVQADSEKLSRLSDEISSFVSTSKKGRVINAPHEGVEDFEPVQHSEHSSFKKDRPVRDDQYVPGRSYAQDDLKRIKGIGILIEQKLKALGVTSYRHIANWSGDDVQYINKTLGFAQRVQQENWIEQARILSEGGETLFSRRVDKGEV